MNATAKAKLEQRAVIALLILFLVTLAGVGKSIGLFGSRAMAGQVNLKGPTTASSPLQVQHPAAQAESVALADVAEQPAQGAVAPNGATTYTAHELRDPLRSLLPEAPVKPDPVELAGVALPTPVVEAKDSSAPVTIQGVWWEGAKTKVMIDGKLYGIGDPLEGATIRSIERDAITVEQSGTMVRLDLTTSTAH